MGYLKAQRPQDKQSKQERKKILRSQILLWIGSHAILIKDKEGEFSIFPAFMVNAISLLHISHADHGAGGKAQRQWQLRPSANQRPENWRSVSRKTVFGSLHKREAIKKNPFVL